MPDNCSLTPTVAVSTSKYTSITFTEHLADEGNSPSNGSVTDAYDNALMGCVIGLHKTGCTRTTLLHPGPHRSIGDVEYATAGWSTSTTTAACTALLG